MTVIQPGMVLAASTAITDPRFAKRVLLLLDYDEDKGATALALNGPKMAEIQIMDEANIRATLSKIESGELDIEPEAASKFSDLLRLLLTNLEPSTVYWGGPHFSFRFLHLHDNLGRKPEDLSEEEQKLLSGLPEQALETKELFPGLYAGSPIDYFEILKTVPKDKRTFRFIQGECRWKAGQIEDEVEGGAWKIHDLKEINVFDIDSINEIVEHENWYEKF